MMQDYIFTSLKLFMEILDSIHRCRKGVNRKNKFSFKNEGNTLHCEHCDLFVESGGIKFSSNCQSFFDDFSLNTNLCQYEEIICIDENFEGINDEGNLTELTSIENIFVDPCESPPPLQQFVEKDPLSMEVLKMKLLDNSSDTHSSLLDVPDAAKITHKIVTWNSDSIVVANKNISNNKQKYPTTLICEYCGLIFKGKDRIYKLFYHRNKIHTKSVEFKCSVCQRIYWGEREFSFHVSSHYNPISICEVCGMQFIRKQDLNRHILIHDKKQLSCIYCHKKFNRKDNLKVHERLHTGHFPFICQMCGSGFPQKHQLKLHSKKCPFTKLNIPNPEIDVTC